MEPRQLEIDPSRRSDWTPYIAQGDPSDSDPLLSRANTCPRDEAVRKRKAFSDPDVAEFIAAQDAQIAQYREVVNGLHNSIARAKAFQQADGRDKAIEALTATVASRDARIANLALDLDLARTENANNSTERLNEEVKARDERISSIRQLNDQLRTGIIDFAEDIKNLLLVSGEDCPALQPQITAIFDTLAKEIRA